MTSTPTPYRGFLDTTRFGPDVVFCTLCCHTDDLVNLLIVKKAHGKSNRHDSSGPLHVHLFSGPDNLEWFIIRRTSSFAKTFHVDVITTLTTRPTSLVFQFGMCVSLPQIIHDLSRVLNVLWICLALLYMFRSLRKSQVIPTVDGSPKVDESTKQASFCVTLLR